MRIVRIRILNFRCIGEAEIYPLKDSVLLGPNNVGKTAVLEALNLLLNPEIGAHSEAIDENDFYRRNYLPPKTQDTPPGVVGAATVEAPNPAPAAGSGATESSDSVGGILDAPRIRIEAVIADLDKSDEDYFRDDLVPWKTETREVVEET